LQATGDACLAHCHLGRSRRQGGRRSDNSDFGTRRTHGGLHPEKATPKFAAPDDSEEPTESTVDLDDSVRSDKDEDKVPYDEEIIDGDSNNNSDPLQTTTALSNSLVHLQIVSTSAHRAKSLMQTRCSLLA
jgi:hypothetical protein